MAQTRKSPKEPGPRWAKKPRPGRGEIGRNDRWPSDYGHRQQQEKEDHPLSAGRMKRKSSKALANVDEQRALSLGARVLQKPVRGEEAAFLARIDEWLTA